MISNRQKYLLKSFSAKLKSIRDSFSGDLFISSRERFLLAFTLDFLNLPEYFYSVYVPKRNGLVFFFNLPSFFFVCFENLFDLSFLPFVETKTDKFSFGFRPYRDCSDVFVQLKKSILKKNRVFLLSKINISNFFSDTNKCWILKNIPLKLSFFKRWLNLNAVHFNKLNYDLLLKFRGGLFFSVFNFILNGLV